MTKQSARTHICLGMQSGGCIYGLLEMAYLVSWELGDMPVAYPHYL